MLFRSKRYKEEQIVRILQQVEQGASVREICREENISEATFYRWRQVYGGMGVSDVKELKKLRAENARLKKIVADQALENAMLKELNSKKW